MPPTTLNSEEPQMAEYQATLQDLFTKSANLQDEIMTQLSTVSYE